VPDPHESVGYTLEAIRLAKRELADRVPLIGFAGAPFTLASYAIEGGGSRDYRRTKQLMHREPDSWHMLMSKLAAMVSDYALAQIAAGADAVQIFDSWAGGVPPALFEDVVIKPAQKIVNAVRRERPDARIIGFPRAVTLEGYTRYVETTGVDAVSLDTSAPMAWAAKALGCTVQGNLDPIALIAGGAALDRAVDAILQAMDGKPHIFNLGHGILPETPIAHVEQLLKRVRG